MYKQYFPVVAVKTSTFNHFGIYFWGFYSHTGGKICALVL